MTTATPEPLAAGPVPLTNQDVDKWLVERVSQAKKTIGSMAEVREADPDSFDPQKFAVARYQLSVFLKLRELFEGVMGCPPILDRFEDPDLEFFRIMQSEGYLPRNSPDQGSNKETK